MPTDQRARTGSLGEDAALRRYLDAGYRLIARNWRCRIGELDLILARGTTLVVCEVKTRRGTASGAGWEAVTAKKQAKLRAVAQAFLASSRLTPTTVRFDVASVAVTGRSRAQVELFTDAF
jgi:putative endonuclease